MKCRGVPVAREDPGGNVTRRGDVTGGGEENNVTKRRGDVTGGGEENDLTRRGGEDEKKISQEMMAKGMASRGCAGKLRHGKLHSAEYVKNYVRVTVMTSGSVTAGRGLSSPPPPLLILAAAFRRRPLPVPTARYTYHVYLPLIFTIFPSLSSGSSSTRNILFIYLLLLCYIILYYILF